MKKKINIFFKSVLLLILTSTFSSHAALISFDNETDFLNAIAAMNSTTIDFDGMTPADTISNGDTVQGITFSYDLGGLSLMVDNFAGTTSPFNYLGTNDSGLFLGGDSFDMSFGSAQMAIGLYVVGSYDELLDEDISLTVGSESVLLSTSSPFDVGDGEAFFIGLMVSDIADAFSSVSLTSADLSQIFNIDDITYASIPEPNSMLLFILALLTFMSIKQKSTI